MKKVTAVLLIIIIIMGLYFSVEGINGKGSVSDRMRLGLDMVGGVSVVMEAQTELTGSELKMLMEQVKAVMEKRVNEFGLTEPVIAIENENRIRIELPGAQDAQSAIEMIGQTAQLSFRTTDDALVVDGKNVKNASSQPYEGYEASLIGTYIVTLEFDAEGAASFEAATRAIVEGRIKSTSDQYRDNQILILLDNNVISEPMVTTIITGTNCQITGSFNQEDASSLAALIRGGSLPVALTEVQTELVGPTLGLDAASNSFLAGGIGIALILVIMLIFYRIMGLVADLSLMLYVLIVLWVMIGLNAVLTLPGIAGIILSVGMAVDSNVIIFSRIREEISLGKSVRVAVQSGYKRAMSTIIDSQVTTIIAAVILYQFGTGSVRGFATTLLIGIIASLLTAVLVSQLFLGIVAESRRFGTEKAFGVVKNEDAPPKKVFNFIAHRKLFYMISVAVLVLGLGIGAIRGYNLGIDFTGGTMMQLNMGREIAVEDIKDVLGEHSVTAEIQHAGENNEKIVLKTTQALSNEERILISNDIQETFSVATPEAEFIEQAGLIGPSVGSQLKTNALKAILLSALAMLAYIAVRFKWKFGVAAIITLFHDALMLLAFYGLFHVQINSPFIAGLLIVIGYSINDTIVIFDRIRENMIYMKKSNLETLIDTSINQSIGRSIMTSVTTVIAILPLIVISGDAIRAFALPLTVGVTLGTVSSITIASGLYYTLKLLTKTSKYKGA
ncbi:MAG: protein translocase subunit SecD [Clostridia bacterium]|nr:protein translocase subunit SecD [Clostridia bacterium]